MDDLKQLMDDFGNEALEANTKIASVAVLLSTGKIAYQSTNWDLTKQTGVLLGILNGNTSFQLNNSKFSVSESSAAGIIATNPSGMGAVILAPFQRGLLVGYVMPFADPHVALVFLIEYATRLNGKG
nr:hypothetical protein [Candidatus Sigynarchaeota archaeon]